MLIVWNVTHLPIVNDGRVAVPGRGTLVALGLHLGPDAVCRVFGHHVRRPFAERFPADDPHHAQLVDHRGVGGAGCRHRA